MSKFEKWVHRIAVAAIALYEVAQEVINLFSN